MAVKTIMIDMDAYTLLAAEKQPDESFSKVIKRRLRPTRTAAGLIAALPRCLLAEETLDQTETLIRSRATGASGAPSLDLGPRDAPAYARYGALPENPRPCG